MSPLLARASGPFLVALSYLVMVAWTWGTWSDPLVDFGRELYVPWRLLAGDRLYVDLAYFNGPLSPHLNALWFLIGGVSLRTLFVANLAIVALVAWLLWQLLRPLTSALASTVGCVVFLLVFAFNQIFWVSIFNWVAPYSHEVTHGVTLGLAALLCLMRHLRSGGRPALLAAGACAGLGFLTKPETFLATAGALVVACVLASPQGGGRAVGRRLWPLVAAGAAVIGVAFACLLLRLPAGDALAGVLGGWLHVFHPGLSGMRYYRELLGIHDLSITLPHSGQWSLIFAVVLLPAAALVWFGRPRSPKTTLALAALTAGANLLLVLIATVRWSKIGQLLPVVVLTLGAVEAVRARRRPAGDGGAQRSVMRASLCAFALLLTLKMLLNLRFEHYGFALAMPAAVLGAVLLIDWLPRVLGRRGGRALPFQTAAAVVLIAATLGQLRSSQGWLDQKTELVGTGADSLRADKRGRCVKEIMAEVLKQRAPGSTLAVLPEGSTLNFWLRMKNSTRFLNLMPPELVMFGKEPILAAYQASPPDFIVLAHKDTAEYGPRFFGTDYLPEMTTWILANYDFVLGAGEEPFVTSQQFGMALLRRK